MERTLRLEEGNVLLERLLLDAKRLKDAKHLLHCVVVLTDLVPFDRPVSTNLLGLLNSAHFLNLGLLALFHHPLCHHELLKHLLLGVLAPPKPCFT